MVAWTRIAAVRISLVAALLLLAPLASAQPAQRGATGSSAWFGLTLPQPPTAAPAVKVGTRPPRPAESVDEGDGSELRGDVIKRDVETIVGFARDSQQSKEIGSGQMWGRIAGFPSSDKTVDWAIDQFRKAGITDVRRNRSRRTRSRRCGCRCRGR